MNYANWEGGLRLKIIPHYPQSEEGIRALAERVAAGQASFACAQFTRLRCPKAQKLELLHAVLMESRRLRMQEQDKQE